MVTRTLALLTFASLSVALVACSTDDPEAENGGGLIEGKACTADAECAGDPNAPVCDLAAGRCAPAPAGAEIGRGDGTSASVELVNLYNTGAIDPVDLAFDPKRPGDVWVVGYGDSSVHVGQGLDGEDPQWTRFKDPAALHFMHKPPAIAMGDNGFWGTCGDNDNSQAARVPNYFMGPALFTTNLDVFAQRTAGGLGSHYDMLHGTPFCRGIAHVEENIYWVFNAHDESLDLYNFNEDHGPGEDDHSDGEIYRYAEGQVKGSEGTPSHVFYDAEDKFLYVADTGNARIVRLDTTKGTKGGPLPRRNEPLKANAMMEGTEVEVVVPAGVLERPSGIEIKGGLIYVTDGATSMFHVFDKSGEEIRHLETDLPPNSLAGFTFGFDGKIWFTDRTGGRVVRIEPL